jgi:hypothetical protein
LNNPGLRKRGNVYPWRVGVSGHVTSSNIAKRVSPHSGVGARGLASWHDHFLDIDVSPAVAGTGESSLSKTASMGCRKS